MKDPELNFLILEQYTCGLYYKHITIVNDDFIMTLQVVASPTIVILTTLKASFMLLANIYSTGVTHDDHHVTIIIYLQYRPQSVRALHWAMHKHYSACACRYEHIKHFIDHIVCLKVQGS